MNREPIAFYYASKRNSEHTRWEHVSKIECCFEFLCVLNHFNAILFLLHFFFFHSIFGFFFGPNFHESVKCLVPFRLFRIWILELKWSRLDIRRGENQNQHGENAHDWCEFVPTKVHWGAQQIHTRIHRNFLGFCSFAHVHKLSTMNTRFAFDCESRKGDQTPCMCKSPSVCVFNGVVQHTV